MGGMTLGKSPVMMMQDREAINASRIPADKFGADIARASMIGQERGLGPAMAQKRLRDAQLRGEMGPPNETFGEDQEEDEYASRRPPLNRAVKNYAKGGKVSSASNRADGCAQKGKTKGRFV